MYFCNRDCYSSKQHATSDIFINERSHTTHVHSRASAEFSSSIVAARPTVSKQKAAFPQFTSLRKMVKPKNEGITIVNVYNCDSKKPPKKRKEKRQKCVFSEEVLPLPVKFEAPKRVMHEEFRENMCLVTDRDRARQLKPQKILPRWQQVEEKCADNLLYMDDYDADQACHDWHKFYEDDARKKAGKCCSERCNCCDCEELIVSKQNDKEKRLESKKKKKIVLNEVGCHEKTKYECHATGAFYGTTETQQLCNSTIRNIIKVEKDIRQLAFTSGSIFPETVECLAKIRWIHEALKLYHTNVRELQFETDEKLQKKSGKGFSMNMCPPPRYDLPFPKYTN